jgi:hypothetical protein
MATERQTELQRIEPTLSRLAAVILNAKHPNSPPVDPSRLKVTLSWVGEQQELLS